jgi:hypothetical protein
MRTALLFLLLALPLALVGCSRPPAGGLLETTALLGESGNAPGQYGYPRCIDSDASTLWIIDKLARVQRIDPASGHALSGFKMPRFENGKPTGVTVWQSTDAGSKGPVLFVADTHEHRVMIYQAQAHAPGTEDEPPPTLIASFGTAGEGPGQFIYLTDVAVLTTDDGKAVSRLYISEYGGNDRINIYEPDAGPWNPALTSTSGPPTFHYVRSFGHFGSGDIKDDVQLSRPQSLAIDARTRELIVSDSCNHRVGRFTLEGDLIAWYGSPTQPTAAPGRFKYPYGIALLGDGSALIAEYGNNRVQRIDLATGDCLGLFGQGGRSKGQLATPWGLAVLGDTVYVLDSGNSRVQAFAKPKGDARVAITTR